MSLVLIDVVFCFGRPTVDSCAHRFIFFIVELLLQNYCYNVSCELGQFGVDAHVDKLRNTPVARFH